MLIVVATEVPISPAAPIGITGVPKFAMLGLPLGSETGLYYFAWTAALRRPSRSASISTSHASAGRCARSPQAKWRPARSASISLRYKVQMFVVGAGMASVSGSLIVHYLRAIDPTVFGFNYSLNLITGTIVGGLLSIWGGALGAVIIVGLRELLRDLALPLWETVIMGGLTVVMLIAFPRGFAGFIGDVFGRLAADGGRKPPWTCDPIPPRSHRYAPAPIPARCWKPLTSPAVSAACAPWTA